MKLLLRMLTVVACTTLVLVSASGQPRGMGPMLPQERAEQLQELLGLTDAQAASIRQILQTSRKVIVAAFEAEEQMRFSMRSATKMIRKEADQQILAILDSRQKEQYVDMPERQLGVGGVQPLGMSDPWLTEIVEIPKDPFGGGPTSGPLHPEARPPFGRGALLEVPFSPTRPMFAADRAARLQDRLGLTDAQTSKIESLFLTQGKEIRKVWESMLDSLEILHARLVKERREVDNEIARLLTDEQREKYREIRSHPHELPAVEDQPLFDVEDQLLFDH
jgi:Spy/CpxP family protein refolding chaperone